VGFRVRFTEGAKADLERLYEFILARDEGDWTVAERAIEAIEAGIHLLEFSPFSCRKASDDNAFLRELLIAFGHSGYVALVEIEDSKTVTVLAVRHQREDDFH
jgi:plasmid stabilization system protein ParE